MRPTVSPSCLSASSWVIFSFETRPPSWPCVTSRALSRPWSTNFCSTSLRTTGTPADAMTWAISPPMVPAPTTAALNTSTARFLPFGSAAAGEVTPLRRGRFLLGLDREAAKGAPERVPQRAADEDHVRQRLKRAVLRQLVLERELDPGALGVLGDPERLLPLKRLLEHLGGESGRSL